MNDLKKLYWKNTLNKRKQASVWLILGLSAFNNLSLVKRWQFSSRHFDVFPGKNVRTFYKNSDCYIEHWEKEETIKVGQFD